MIETTTKQNILDCMPYKHPFRFIDEILEISDDHIVGCYTFKENEFFYEGHFPENPITPGAILSECMAQIGLVALGIHLCRATPEQMKTIKTLFSSNESHYYRMVLPREKVIVRSTKVFFRLKNLKCKVRMETESGDLICEATMVGVIATI